LGCFILARKEEEEEDEEEDEEEEEEEGAEEKYRSRQKGESLERYYYPRGLLPWLQYSNQTPDKC
jgi:hypothetical protein